MSTPVARSTLLPDSADPLSPTTPTSHLAVASQLSPVRPPSSSPLSFKRRGASNPARPGMGAKAVSMLGGLLSRSPSYSGGGGGEDRVPQPPASSSSRRPSVPAAPSFAPARTAIGGGGGGRRSEPRFLRPDESGYSQAFTSDTETDMTANDDDEEEEEEEEDLTRSTISALGGKGWKRRESSSAGAGGLGSGKGARRPVSGATYPRVASAAQGGAGGEGGGEVVEAVGWVTPLPKIPILVLSIAMFGEFFCASVSSPFMFFMVESFGVGAGPNGGGESAVSLWTGIVSSVFFLSQFITAMIWVSVSAKHGRRAVLCSSLVGSGLTVIAFGTSTNLGTAITTRLAMGVFGGAIGVARSAIQDVTDESNRSAAYTILGLVWGLGGIAGNVVGGMLEHPAEKFPTYFGDRQLFITYPYVLPCLVAGSVTLFGGFLSLFLNRDGGQRTGGIHLPTEKDVEVAASTLSKVKDYLLSALASLFFRFYRRQPISLGAGDGNVSLRPSSAHIPPLPSPAPSPSLTDALSAERRPSRQCGSAYGYSRQPSQSGFSSGVGGGGGGPGESGLRIPSMRSRGLRTFSMATSSRYDPDADVPHSFAERLLLANNQAVFSLSDVFIAKAAADDQYSAIEYEGSVLADEESRLDATDFDETNSQYGDVGFGTAPPSMDDLRDEAYRQDLTAAATAASVGDASLMPPPPRPVSPTNTSAPGQRMSPASPTRERIVSFGPGSLPRPRRVSVGSTRPMSIYSNTGLAPSSLPTFDATLASASSQRPDESGFAPMAAIPETRAASIIERGEGEDALAGQGSWDLIGRLPLDIIVGYFLIGLHSTACDMCFGVFLVTAVSSGGLGLSAQHFSILQAIMFFFQLVWNFRFYPSVGPPNGPLSHLSMLRLGLLCYVPVYLLFPELRGLIIVEGENALVMMGMVVLSAIQRLANTLAYTSVMVLINVCTPAELVPLANGLAQSCISLARFIGPLLGGSVFAASIKDGPNAHPWPFNYAAGFVLTAVLCFTGFLLSWRIR
ncbi:hypothetical protein JCM8547_009312 [Rhodosporidiobolus lusitaniae]